MIKGLITVILVLETIFCYSQWNTARLSVLNGGNIEAIFNNIPKYKSGITLTNYTTLGITLTDLNSTDPNSKVDGFTISVRSYNGQASIEGENPANTIPLNRIQLVPTNALGLSSATYTSLDLSSVFQTLVSYTDPNCPCNDPPNFTNLHWSTHQVNVTYKIGVPVASGGNGDFLDIWPPIEPDYYTVEIEYELAPLVH